MLGLRQYHEHTATAVASVHRTEAEIDQVLGQKRATVFKPHYRVKAGGNADISTRSDPHGEFAGLNCLIEAQSVAESAAAAGEQSEHLHTSPLCRLHPCSYNSLRPVEL